MSNRAVNLFFNTIGDDDPSLRLIAGTTVLRSHIYAAADDLAAILVTFHHFAKYTTLPDRWFRISKMRLTFKKCGIIPLSLHADDTYLGFRVLLLIVFLSGTLPKYSLYLNTSVC